MAFDKIVGVDGTTYQFPTLVRTRISDNIKQAGSVENLAVLDALSGPLAGKSSTSHNHNLADLNNNGIDKLGDVEIGVVGLNGIALDDKHTLQYEASTSTWRNKVASGGVTVGDSRPTSPIPGDAWFDSNDGTLYVYYADANTTQWVQVKANSALEGTILSRLGALESRATALEASPNYSPNYLINGAFDVWQRGTSGFANNAYCADRWIASINNTAITRTSMAVGNVTTYGMTFTTSSATNTNGLLQALESTHANALRGKTVTLSFYGQASSAGAVLLADIQTSSTADSATTGFSVLKRETLATTTGLTRYTVTTTIPADSTSAGIRVVIMASNLPSGGTFTVTGVQLEEGSVPTPFRRAGLTIQGELAACQRYYWRISAQNLSDWFSNGQVYNSTLLIFPFQFPVTMRAIPSTTVEWNGSLSGFVARSGSATLTLSGTPIIANDSDGKPSTNMIQMYWYLTGAGATAGGTARLLGNNTTGAYIGFSAEL